MTLPIGAILQSRALFCYGEKLCFSKMHVIRHTDFFFTVVPCILILSKSFIYQLMHNRVALKEY
jgi:hypothetical protein